MNKILFNLHDLTLAMTALLCALLAFLFLIAQKQKHTSSPLLASFLLAHTFIALHELTYYGEQFRYTILDISPNLFFIGSFGYCVDAALLYLFAKTVMYQNFRISKAQLSHLLPLVLFAGYMLAVYYLQNADSKQLAIRQYSLTTSWHYIASDLIIKLVRVAYVIACLRLIGHYHDQQKESRADLSTVALTWLRTLVIGFVVVMAGDALLASIKVIGLYTPMEIALLSDIGVTIYHLTFLLLLALLTYTIARLPLVEQVQLKSQPQPQESSSYKADHVERIELHMRQHKPYLDSEITIDALAAALAISPKVLSVTLNHHFQKNFYEFINCYRIEDAKQALIEQPGKTITDIFYEVGFNSKSVFYTFFKKSEGMTPSAYRKQHASQ
ncbi:helix-turn-helix domain-containing protein [Neiella marina]|uniref:Helix-turn-helix domain-containing protein n=1 Tax=Neiella holothuriorum TaxID=2870530 RepID=A0ABS7EBZ6_9GAMM|nr:helix-turn-helix domain-containing protein [Neiella holothuriorum]MBW8189852.1 helix-turn-helix domain-containing protein [Neiella holothuriorum]